MPTEVDESGISQTAEKPVHPPVDDVGLEGTLEVPDGAGHLFEGEDELELVADVVAEWFVETLR